jgi:hypothetical protein
MHAYMNIHIHICTCQFAMKTLAALHNIWGTRYLCVYAYVHEYIHTLWNYQEANLGSSGQVYCSSFYSTRAHTQRACDVCVCVCVCRERERERGRERDTYIHTYIHPYIHTYTRTGGNKISAAGAKSMAAALFYTPLMSLDISYNDLNSDGMMAIASALPFQTRLSTLNVRGNRIGLAGLSALLTGLRNPDVVTTFDLAENSICSGGMAALASWMYANTSLRDLDLSGNTVCAGEPNSGEDVDLVGFSR